MNTAAPPIAEALARINEFVADFREGLLRIDREFSAAARDKRELATAGREKRKADWRMVMAGEWKKAADATRRASSGRGQQQPSFASFGREQPPAASEIPVWLSIGSQHVCFEQFSCQIPHAVAFPFSHPLTVAAGDPDQQRLIHQLLLRLLSVLPPGLLELTFVDPLKLGQSVEPFLQLLKVQPLVPHQRVLTRAEHIEAAFDALTEAVEELIQCRFSDQTPDWSSYNAANADNPLPYRVVTLFDVPEQLSEKGLWLLQRLCDNGPRCGVLPIIATDAAHVGDNRYGRFHAALASKASPLPALLTASDPGIEGMTLVHHPEPWPSQEALDAFIATVSARYVAKVRFTKSLPELWAGAGKGAASIQGFRVPIGWTPSGDTVPLILGATVSEHHVLLAGKTGSGKSNLLHVLIHSLCERYAPTEVDLYLLDYKESTEFNVYADPPLPHARLVATESDPEYGVTVLQHLVHELEKRARIFKAVNVRDFAEYRKSSGEVLPRALLIIDEFQVLFSDKGEVAQAAEQLLSRLLKQGRSFGIHILLATQTLKGMGALSVGALVTQLGCRLALACGQEDSAMILGSNNWAAADLRSPPEGIINSANGAKSGNVKFLIPLAEPAFAKQHLEDLAARAARRAEPAKARIFNGAKLPHMPPSGTFEQVSGRGDALVLGESLTFDADPLTVPLTRRSAFNVLFCGRNDSIHDGLLASTLSSLASGGFDEVVYFNGSGLAPGRPFVAAVQRLGARFRRFDELASLPLQHLLNDIGSRRVALIIDGLDQEKLLQPSPSFRALKPNEPPSYADMFKRILEEGSRKGTFVFAFVESWQRFAAAGKDVLNQFDLRVAFCMNEDDASAFVSGGIGKLRGVEVANRAIFVNRMTNEKLWFRPYT